jgi:hypothetical protein
MRYTDHNCPSAYKKNVQVPVCPLCNQPVPVGKNQQADEIVGAHMDNDCQSQPAQARRKVTTVVKVANSDCSNYGWLYFRFSPTSVPWKDANKRKLLRCFALTVSWTSAWDIGTCKTTSVKAKKLAGEEKHRKLWNLMIYFIIPSSGPAVCYFIR